MQAAIDSSNAGIQFLFGPVLPGQDAGPVFAFQVLPIIIFFASLTSVLYYLGVMQFVVNGLGRGLQKALGTESLSVTSDIFLGPTEAPPAKYQSKSGPTSPLGSAMKPSRDVENPVPTVPTPVLLPPA